MPRLVPDEAWAVMNIWMEARGEPYAGKLAVAEVMRERMRRKFASDGTVTGTILAKYQFSGWNTTDPNRLAAAKLDMNDRVVQECARAWEESAHSRTVPGAVFYYNPSVVSSPVWAVPAKRVAVVGAHHFFSA